MNTPALKKLMAAYLHQDFLEVDGGVWEAIDSYVAGEPTLARELPHEIASVLAQMPAEAEVEAYLDELGCEYWADPAAGGYRGWLTEINQRVTRATTD